MPDLTPIPSAQRPSDPGYQPVSGYAVASAVAAGLFALLLVVVAIVAITSRRTAFSYELLILPVLGIILAAIGRSQIRNSEGTRIGVRLTTVSWWVCVLGGAGFVAYVYANQVVIERNSASFADRFFDSLKAGQLTRSFDSLLPIEERGRTNSDTLEEYDRTYGQSGFWAFRNSDLVHLFRRNGQAMEYQRVGSKDVGQDSSGFHATHIYKMQCPEGTYNVQVKLMAAEPRKGGRPEWRIPGQPNPNIVLKIDQQSEYGRLIQELQQDGEAFARQWFVLLSNQRFTIAQLFTTPAEHRRPWEDSLSHATALGGAPGSLFPLRPAFLPVDRAARVEGKGKSPGELSFLDLVGTGFFQQDDAGTPMSEEKRDKLRELWESPMIVPAMNRYNQPTKIAVDLTFTSVTPDKVTVVVGADLYFEGRVLIARTTVGVECTRPEVLAALNSAREKGLGARADDAVVTLRNLPARDWRIAWLRSDMEGRNPNPIDGPPPG